MATKKISELTKVTSIQDTDLLIVETSNGTRAIKKSDLVSDIVEMVDEITIPTKLSELTGDDTHRVVTDAEKYTWNAKVDTSALNTAINNAKVKTGSITLATSSWSGSGTTYTQTVTISGGTSKSKIDLQPNGTTLNQLIADGVSALYIENNNGAFKAYAIGAKPTVNLTIQFTRTEVG